ncbi:MAG: ClpP family protease [Proteobacteria bacterium]|nr:ClpP family protease [Pseudomonadota bacterium]
MDNKETKNLKEETERYFNALTAKYFDGLVGAHAAGGNIADYVDLAGMDALKKITNAGFVPTVTEIDGSGRPVGYDLFSRLMKDRIVLLDGEVNATMAAIACASLLFLAHIDEGGNAITDQNQKVPPIKVFIDSPGGSVLAGLAIYDTMRSISAPIITTGMGMQASMGSILLAAGDVRKMTRSSKLMIHQISGGTEGKESAQAVGMGFTEQLHEDLKSIYVRHIGLTHEFFDLALEHDTWLTADQALKMGFIHEIIEGTAKKTAYEDESKRSEERKGLAGELNRVAAKYIDNMSAAEIVSKMNSVSADGGVYAAHRGELVTKLSQFPEFWTEAKKKEMAVKAAAAAPANDDVAIKPVSAAKKQSGGPSN